jgi:hypothetical protein
MWEKTYVVPGKLLRNERQDPGNPSPDTSIDTSAAVFVFEPFGQHEDES